MKFKWRKLEQTSIIWVLYDNKKINKKKWNSNQENMKGLTSFFSLLEICYSQQTTINWVRQEKKWTTLNPSNKCESS